MLFIAFVFYRIELLGENNMNNRRKIIIALVSFVVLPFVFVYKNGLYNIKNLIKTLLIQISKWDQKRTSTHLGKGDKKSEVFISKNGTPQENLRKAISMLGGIDKYIGKKDIVVIKPNLQWWNQGRSNLAAIKAFIDILFEMPNFKGEVIIAENIHFMDENLPESERDNIRGWTHFSEINGDIEGVNHNVNSLIELYTKQGFNNISKCHWRDGGGKRDLWGNGKGGGLTDNPLVRDGYYWSSEEYIFKGFFGMKKWKVKMSYPIFTSSYSGITIDLKKGAFRRNRTTGTAEVLDDRKVRLINFAALNTHGDDTGITSAVKNYMGITDMSCGYWGLEPKNYANIHFCGDRYYRHAKAGPIGHFIKTIKKADINIVTAEWVGWGSRTDITKAAQAKTILVSTDPFALDYVGAKNIVLPISKNNRLHDPENFESPIHKYLLLALNACGSGTIDPANINIRSYDYLTNEYTQRA